MKHRKRPYVGSLNDGFETKNLQKVLPFLSLYKIMPTEGEIEKYVKLQKEKGFTASNMAVASNGKKLDNEAERKAETDPGRLVTPQELNELAGFVGNQEEKQSTSFEDTETERTD